MLHQIRHYLENR